MTSPAKPPRSVWVSPSGVVFSHTFVPGWLRYDLHRPRKGKPKPRRGAKGRKA